MATPQRSIHHHIPAAFLTYDSRTERRMEWNGMEWNGMEWNGRMGVIQTQTCSRKPNRFRRDDTPREKERAVQSGSRPIRPHPSGLPACLPDHQVGWLATLDFFFFSAARPAARRGPPGPRLQLQLQPAQSASEQQLYGTTATMTAQQLSPAI